jgi:predicted O-methyltransferase YrrM
MSRSLLPEAVEQYVSRFCAEPSVEQRLRAETATLPDAGMQIGPDQAAFMALLVRLIGARRCLEVGTFTGYSALAVARALPEDGQLITCDINEEWTAIARRYWKEAGVAEKIDLRLGPAVTTLEKLLVESGAGSFDFAFIDADKTAYDAYYEFCLQLVRPGGIILIDNVIWNGKVADPSVTDPDTTAIRRLNNKIREERRAEATLLTVGDGVMLLRNVGTKARKA